MISGTLAPNLGPPSNSVVPLTPSELQELSILQNLTQSSKDSRILQFPADRADEREKER